MKATSQTVKKDYTKIFQGKTCAVVIFSSIYENQISSKSTIVLLMLRFISDICLVWLPPKCFLFTGRFLHNPAKGINCLICITEFCLLRFSVNSENLHVLERIVKYRVRHTYWIIFICTFQLSWKVREVSLMDPQRYKGAIYLILFFSFKRSVKTTGVFVIASVRAFILYNK